MITNHVVLHTTSAHMPAVQDASVALVVTSPPYPMIEMWDSCFCTQDQEIAKALREGAAALLAAKSLRGRKKRPVAAAK